MNSVAVDTNILVYLHDENDGRKRGIAKSLLADNPKISSQVVSEYLNTTRKLLTLSKEDLLFQTAELFRPCEIIPTQPSTLYLASELIQKYRFQLFDAVIAAALEGNYNVLHSEDMQDGLLVNGSLTIVNPFL